VVNRIYNLFKEDKNLQKDIKFIAIALGNSPEEVQGYKDNFKVEFPLFADPKKEFQEKMKVKAVPFTVLLDNKGKIIMDHSGNIGNFDEYVTEIKKQLKAR
jgi:hypothetical protein